MKKSRILLIVAAAIFLGLLFQEKLIQTYVCVFHENLEAYAVKLLDTSDAKRTRYGLWDVKSYPKDQMVEFMTGGFGLAPSSTYKGFYYSEDNIHKVFSVADKSIALMETDGDRATWTDGTDNHGKSIRITENWFWFEVSF